MEIEIALGSDRRANRRDSGAPERVLVIGSFSGAGGSRAASPNDRAVMAIDPFDIDPAIEAIRPETGVSGGGDAAPLAVSSLDDFHPDTLCQQLPELNRIITTRRSLTNSGAASDGAVQAARALVAELGAGRVAKSTEPGAGPAAPETDDDTLARLLGGSPAPRTAASPAAKSAVARLIADAVGDSGSVDGAIQSGLVDALDSLATSIVRDVLHSDAFRHVESAWRSLRWLAEHLDSDVDCELFVFDLGIDELTAISASGPAEADALRAHIARQWRNLLMDDPATLIVSLHPLAADSHAIAALRWLMDLAQETGAPLFAGAGCELAGITAPPRTNPLVDASDVSKETDPAWDGLRQHPAAAQTAVGVPQFILRQPYGRKSDPIDAFSFEELEEAPGDDAFLWASAAIALAVAWLQSRAGASAALNDLPMVIYEDGGGQAMMPPTGIYVSDSAATALAGKGFTALRAARHSTNLSVPEIVTVASR